MAQYFFGQSLMLGIRTRRIMMSCFLIYFPLNKALQTGILEKKDIIKMIYIIGTFEMILFTIQYLIIDKVVFLNFTYSDEIELRMGMRRVRYPIELILFLAFINLDSLLNNKKHKIINFAYILWFIIILVFMVQKRTQILSFFLSIISIIVFWKKNFGIKIMIGTIVMISVIGFALNSPIIQSSFNTILNRGGQDDTLTIREKGIEYYKERIKESPIFGFGYPNEDCAAAVIASGKQYHYYLADDGVFGFYYIYGLSGIIWLIAFWIMNFKKSMKIYKLKKCYLYILYFIYESADLYIGMKWYYYWPLVMVIFFSLLDFDSHNLKQIEINN